jgi:MFS transporter, DHA1 family, multidrug resistance protein
VLGNDAAAMGTAIAGGLVLSLAVLVLVVRPWTLADVAPEPAAAA